MPTGVLGVLTGEMLSAADAPKTREDESKVINDFWKPSYFRWVETSLDKGSGAELVPLKHFLHRFTRSIFWELEDMIPLCVPHPLVAPVLHLALSALSLWRAPSSTAQRAVCCYDMP